MSEYTKGPWILEEGKTRKLDHMNVVHSDNSVGAASSVVAKVTCRSSWIEEHKANARLIAAAPDLLEALIGVVRVADRATVEFDAARAAIAKATAHQQANRRET